MEDQEFPVESQIVTEGPLTGASAPPAHAVPTEPDIHGKPPRTRPASRFVPACGRKRLVSRLHRRAHYPGIHPATALEHLRDSQSELRRLSVQLMTIQEKERQRIAADLHDGIGQSLSLIKLSVESGLQFIAKGESGKGFALLRGVTHKLNDAIAELRRTTSDLRPPMLDDLGIIATLTWFIRELEPVCKGKKIGQEVTLAESDVPAPIKPAIFRILQEAINNVLKHSNADEVRVCLKKLDAGIQFSVEDNGHGFEPGLAVPCRKPYGFGLLTMKERAMSSGGVFEVESAPGRGTRIAVTWRPAEAPGRAMPAGRGRRNT